MSTGKDNEGDDDDIQFLGFKPAKSNSKPLKRIGHLPIKSPLHVSRAIKSPLLVSRAEAEVAVLAVNCLHPRAPRTGNSIQRKSGHVQQSQPSIFKKVDNNRVTSQVHQQHLRSSKEPPPVKICKLPLLVTPSTSSAMPKFKLTPTLNLNTGPGMTRANKEKQFAPLVHKEGPRQQLSGNSISLRKSIGTPVSTTTATKDKNKVVSLSKANATIQSKKASSEEVKSNKNVVKESSIAQLEPSPPVRKKGRPRKNPQQPEQVREVKKIPRIIETNDCPAMTVVTHSQKNKAMTPPTAPLTRNISLRKKSIETPSKTSSEVNAARSNRRNRRESLSLTRKKEVSSEEKELQRDLQSRNARKSRGRSNSLQVLSESNASTTVEVSSSAETTDQDKDKRERVSQAIKKDARLALTVRVLLHRIEDQDGLTSRQSKRLEVDRNQQVGKNRTLLHDDDQIQLKQRKELKEQKSVGVKDTQQVGKDRTVLLDDDHDQIQDNQEKELEEQKSVVVKYNKQVGKDRPLLLDNDQIQDYQQKELEEQTSVRVEDNHQGGKDGTLLLDDVPIEDNQQKELEKQTSVAVDDNQQVGKDGTLLLDDVPIEDNQQKELAEQKSVGIEDNQQVGKDEMLLLDDVPIDDNQHQKELEEQTNVGIDLNEHFGKDRTSLLDDDQIQDNQEKEMEEQTMVGLEDNQEVGKDGMYLLDEDQIQDKQQKQVDDQKSVGVEDHDHVGKDRTLLLDEEQVKDKQLKELEEQTSVRVEDNQQVGKDGTLLLDDDQIQDKQQTELKEQKSVGVEDNQQVDKDGTLLLDDVPIEDNQQKELEEQTSVAVDDNQQGGKDGALLLDDDQIQDKQHEKKLEEQTSVAVDDNQQVGQDGTLLLDDVPIEDNQQKELEEQTSVAVDDNQQVGQDGTLLLDDDQIQDKQQTELKEQKSVGVEDNQQVGKDGTLLLDDEHIQDNQHEKELEEQTSVAVDDNQQVGQDGRLILDEEHIQDNQQMELETKPLSDNANEQQVAGGRENCPSIAEFILPPTLDFRLEDLGLETVSLQPQNVERESERTDLFLLSCLGIDISSPGVNGDIVTLNGQSETNPIEQATNSCSQQVETTHADSQEHCYPYVKVPSLSQCDNIDQSICFQSAHLSFLTGDDQRKSFCQDGCQSSFSEPGHEPLLFISQNEHDLSCLTSVRTTESYSTPHLSLPQLNDANFSECQAIKLFEDEEYDQGFQILDKPFLEETERASSKSPQQNIEDLEQRKASPRTVQGDPFQLEKDYGKLTEVRRQPSPKSVQGHTQLEKDFRESVEKSIQPSPKSAQGHTQLEKDFSESVDRNIHPSPKSVQGDAQLEKGFRESLERSAQSSSRSVQEDLQESEKSQSDGGSVEESMQESEEGPWSVESLDDDGTSSLTGIVGARTSLEKCTAQEKTPPVSSEESTEMDCAQAEGPAIKEGGARRNSTRLSIIDDDTLEVFPTIPTVQQKNLDQMDTKGSDSDAAAAVAEQDTDTSEEEDYDDFDVSEEIYQEHLSILEAFMNEPESTKDEEGEVQVTRVYVSVYYCKICDGRFHDWEDYCKHLQLNHEFSKENLLRVAKLKPGMSSVGNVDDLESSLGHKIPGRQEKAEETESEWDDLDSDFDYSDEASNESSDSEFLEDNPKNRRKGLGLTHPTDDPEYSVSVDSDSENEFSDPEYTIKAPRRKQTSSTTSGARKKTADNSNHGSNEKAEDTKCFVCDYQFSTRFNLARHFKKRPTHKAASAAGQLKNQKIGEKEGSNSEKEERTKAKVKPTKTIVQSSSSKKANGCFICFKKFAKEDALDAHLIQCHLKKSSFSCSYCEKPLLNEAALGDHLTYVPLKSKSKASVGKSEHIQRQDVGCGMCEKKFRHRGCLLFHVKAHLIEEKDKTLSSPAKKFRCCLCTSATPEHYVLISALENHMQDHFTKKCPRCRKLFLDMEHLIKHTWVCSHPMRIYTCPACQNNFSHISLLTSHLKIAHEDCGVVCDGCGHVFPNQTDLNRHHEEKTCRTMVKCQICGRCFPDVSSLEKHMKSHPFPGQYGWGSEDGIKNAAYGRIKSEIMNDSTKATTAVALAAATPLVASCSVAARIPATPAFSRPISNNTGKRFYSQGFKIPKKSNESSPVKSAAVNNATVVTANTESTGPTDLVQEGLSYLLNQARVEPEVRLPQEIPRDLLWVGPRHSTPPTGCIEDLGNTPTATENNKQVKCVQNPRAASANPLPPVTIANHGIKSQARSMTSDTQLASSTSRGQVVKFIDNRDPQITVSLGPLSSQERKVSMSAQNSKRQSKAEAAASSAKKSVEPNVQFVSSNMDTLLAKGRRGKGQMQRINAKNPSTYPCHRCDQEFKTSKQLQIHLTSKHLTRCSDVEITLNNTVAPAVATNNNLTTGGQPLFSRSSILAPASTWDPNQKHVRLMDQFPGSKLNVLDAFRCQACFINFPSKEELQFHMSYRHYQLKCVTCGQVFENSGQLSAHNLQNHPKEVEKKTGIVITATNGLGHPI